MEIKSAENRASMRKIWILQNLRFTRYTRLLKGWHGPTRTRHVTDVHWSGVACARRTSLFLAYKSYLTPHAFCTQKLISLTDFFLLISLRNFLLKYLFFLNNFPRAQAVLNPWPLFGNNKISIKAWFNGEFTTPLFTHFKSFIGGIHVRLLY